MRIVLRTSMKAKKLRGVHRYEIRISNPSSNENRKSASVAINIYNTVSCKGEKNGNIILSDLHSLGRGGADAFKVESE